jgi:hypothetical protein
LNNVIPNTNAHAKVHIERGNSRIALSFGIFVNQPMTSVLKSTAQGSGVPKNASSRFVFFVAIEVTNVGIRLLTVFPQTNCQQQGNLFRFSRTVGPQDRNEKRKSVPQRG